MVDDDSKVSPDRNWTDRAKDIADTTIKAIDAGVVAAGLALSVGASDVAATLPEMNPTNQPDHAIAIAAQWMPIESETRDDVEPEVSASTQDTRGMDANESRDLMTDPPAVADPRMVDASLDEANDDRGSDAMGSVR